MPNSQLSDTQARITRDNDIRYESNSELRFWLGQYREMNDEQLKQERVRLHDEWMVMHQAGRRWTSELTIKQGGGLLGFILIVTGLFTIPHATYTPALVIVGAILFYLCIQAEKKHRETKKLCEDKQRLIGHIQIERGTDD